MKKIFLASIAFLLIAGTVSAQRGEDAIRRDVNTSSSFGTRKDGQRMGAAKQGDFRNGRLSHRDRKDFRKGRHHRHHRHIRHHRRHHRF